MMNLSPVPQHTKQTRCNNNFRSDNNNRNVDFFRPVISNNPVALSYNHEHYDNGLGMGNGMMNGQFFDIERSAMNTRNNSVDSRKPVQTGFQNDYFTMNYETLNNQYAQHDQDVNRYLTRNPVNTRRDDMEKIRNKDKQEFLKRQNGFASPNNEINLGYENTRKNRNNINSSSYVPMARTMAIPRENV